MSETIVQIVLGAACRGCWTGLDLGSGPGKHRPPLPQWNTVDAYAQAPSDGHITGPLLEVLPTLIEQSDLVYAMDVIEHMEKKEGFVLLQHMLRLARRRVLLFTPNGFSPQESENPWQVHRSGWRPSDFRKLGFQTAVMDFDYGQGKGLQPSAALWAWKAMS